MSEVKVFSFEESPYHPGYYTIKVDHSSFYMDYTEGSYHVIQARLLDLTYAQYLRFCRDVMGASIFGKGSYYPVAYFKKNEGLNKLIGLLNARANFVIFNREHPDYDKHKQFVKEYQSKLRR